MAENFSYGDQKLGIGIALSLSKDPKNAVFSKKAIKRIKASSEHVAKMADSPHPVYGINTGFGPLCTTVISSTQSRLLQENILKSHSVGVGNPIHPSVVRLMLLLKIQSLSLGYSGVRLETLERIHTFLQEGLIPVVPKQGSVGASGDLAPLAHLFLPLIGLGSFLVEGKAVPAKVLLDKKGIKPLSLGPKEGLALINGTQFISAFAIRGIDRLKNALDCADLIGAMSLESLMGSGAPFQEQLHELRPFSGTQWVAHRLRKLLANSEILASHIGCNRVQDPYSLRCMPQVHGASRNAWIHLKELCEIEINSVTDNPIILSEKESISGGNFHGQTLAMALDYNCVAASELGNISDRRSYLLLEGKVEGLPKLLMHDTGINSGFMIPQYTSAALASENKSLCFPASSDSIPTSLGQEDHVSMGSISARRLNQICSNVEKILAVELVCAAQAFDFRRPLKSGPILEHCHALIRKHIDHADKDRIFGDDLQTAIKLIRDRHLANEAQKSATRNNIALEGDFNERFGIH